MKKIFTLIFLLFSFVSFGQIHLGNVQTIGQPTRNQAIGNGLEIADTLVANGKVAFPLITSGGGDTTNYKPLGMNAAGYLARLSYWVTGGGGSTALPLSEIAVGTGTGIASDPTFKRDLTTGEYMNRDASWNGVYMTDPLTGLCFGFSLNDVINTFGGYSVIWIDGATGQVAFSSAAGTGSYVGLDFANAVLRSNNAIIKGSTGGGTSGGQGITDIQADSVIKTLAPIVRVAATDSIQIKAPVVRVTSLAGTGTQMVTADINGVVSKQAIPSGTVTSVATSNGITGGTITGTGTISGINAAADGSTKGVAAFNSTNFSSSSGIINTIQNIDTPATPRFKRIGIGHASDNNSLSVKGNTLDSGTVKIVDGTQGDGRVFTSDATGLGSWVNPDTIITLTIAQAQAKDVANSWKEGKWYQIKDNTGSFSGAWALYSYTAVASNDTANRVRLSETGMGYVRDSSGVQYPYSAEIGYSVTRDLWRSCFLPKQGLTVLDTGGTSMNEIHWDAWTHSTIKYCSFLDDATDRRLRLINNCDISNARIDWNNKPGVYLNGVVIAPAVSGNASTQIEFLLPTYGISESRIGSGVVATVTGGFHGCTIENDAIIIEPLAWNTVDNLDECTFGTGNLLDLSYMGMSNFFEGNVMGCGNHLVPNEDQLNKWWIGKTSTFTQTIDVDTAVDVSGTLRVGYGQGVITLASGTSTPTTIKNITDMDGNPVNDRDLKFYAFIDINFDNSDAWMKFRSPKTFDPSSGSSAPSTYVITSNGQDYITFTWDDVSSIYLQTDAAKY